MSNDQVVLIVYSALAAGVVLLPLRWSLIAYLLLSTVDLGPQGEHLGLLNAAKAIVLPLYLLWRLRQYAGHRNILLAPISWILLTIYAAVAASWSFFPILALKLTGHMIASLVICCVFMRASKGTELQANVVLPTTIGILVVAGLRTIFAPQYGEEAARFTTFSTAQSFASLIVALYCIALCSKALRPAVRFSLCAALIVALAFDGSRLWALGLAMSSLLALLVSEVRSWVKICVVGFVIVMVAAIAGSTDRIVSFLSGPAQSNRIAAAIAAAYEGDMASSGLGTFRFRRGLTAIVVDQLEKSSVQELIFGHGTSNGGTMATARIKWLDPNRFFHNEWLRVIYEWGMIGLLLFLTFIGSIATFAFHGVRNDRSGVARPLLVFLPAFLLGLTGENIIAGAGNAVTVGFLLLIGLASAAYRTAGAHVFAEERLLIGDSAASRERRPRQENWAAPIV